MSTPPVGELGRLLAERRYYADEGLLTALHLALVLGRPLALEGEPGVGKTEVAKALADVLGRELIRLQCYEGLDASQALYEWDHPKQLLHVRVAEAEGRDVGELYDERFLMERPLLRAVRHAENAVLLIDEIDRSDPEFEAFLLEFLSDFQITIPELGTIVAPRPPIVVLTSNRTRELHDALKRRCLYHWIPFPDAARERLILRAYAPGLDEAAADALVNAITRVRAEKLLKRPGIAETIDWAQGASVLAAEGTPWPDALKRSLGLLLKEQEDVERAEAGARGGAVSDRAREHLHGFLRSLDDAGVRVGRREARGLPARRRALAARRRRRAVLARAGHAGRARRGLRGLRRRLRRVVPRRAPARRGVAAGAAARRRGRDRGAARRRRGRARGARAERGLRPAREPGRPAQPADVPGHLRPPATTSSPSCGPRWRARSRS